MRNILIILFLLFTFCLFAQQNSSVYVVRDYTTQFGKTLRVGTQVINISDSTLHFITSLQGATNTLSDGGSAIIGSADIGNIDSILGLLDSVVYPNTLTDLTVGEINAPGNFFINGEGNMVFNSGNNFAFNLGIDGDTGTFNIFYLQEKYWDKVLVWDGNSEVQYKDIGYIDDSLNNLDKYVYLDGRSGGQVVHGGVLDGESLTLRANSDPTNTVSNIYFGLTTGNNSVYNAQIGQWGFGILTTNEAATVGGRISTLSINTPTQTASYGKWFTNGLDNDHPYYTYPLGSGGNERLALFSDLSGFITTEVDPVWVSDSVDYVSLAGPDIITGEKTLQGATKLLFRNNSHYISSPTPVATQINSSATIRNTIGLSGSEVDKLTISNTTTTVFNDLKADECIFTGTAGTVKPLGLGERVIIETSFDEYGWVHTDGTDILASYLGSSFGSGSDGMVGTESNLNLSLYTYQGGSYNNFIHIKDDPTAANAFIGISEAIPLYGLDNNGTFRSQDDAYLEQELEVDGLTTVNNTIHTLATTSDDNLILEKSNSSKHWTINAGRSAFFDQWLLFTVEGETAQYTFAIRPDGTIRGRDGSAGAPMYAFDNASNFGMSYQSSTDRLVLSTEGFQRLRIENDGTLNVGGTTNYETLVTTDDDIPNKKYVDDAIANYVGVLYEDNLTTVNHLTTGVYYTIKGLADGGAKNLTQTDSTITISETGLYYINYSISCTHATNNTVIHTSLFISDSEETELEAERKIGTAGDVGSYSSGGVISLTANDVIKLKTKADKTGIQSISHMNFTLFKI